MNKAHEAETPATGHAEIKAFNAWLVQQGNLDEVSFTSCWQAACAWQRAALLAEIKAGGVMGYLYRYADGLTHWLRSYNPAETVELYRLPEGE